MKARRLFPVLAAVVLAAGLVGAGIAFEAVQAAPKASGIQGTWILVSRDLPDGARQTPPDIAGMATWTGRHRNFNVFWKDPGSGKPFSISMISEYSLTGSTYSEKCLYMMVNDGISGAGASYNMEGESGSAPVTREGKRLSMKLPLFGEPEVVFDGDRLTATRKGEFVDHWKRVD